MGGRAGRLGRRDRKTPWLDLRTPPVAALAQDEVRASQEFVVGGFTDPQGGASASAPCWSGTTTVMFCIRRQDRHRLRHEASARSARPPGSIEIPKTPFTRAVGLPRLRAHWVRPEIVVQVGFIQWTGNDKLRHPRLLGVRTDKERTRRDPGSV